MVERRVHCDTVYWIDGDGRRRLATDKEIVIDGDDPDFTGDFAAPAARGKPAPKATVAGVSVKRFENAIHMIGKHVGEVRNDLHAEIAALRAEIIEALRAERQPPRAINGTGKRQETAQ